MSNSTFFTNRFQFSNDLLSVQTEIDDNNLLVITESVAASGTNVIACVFNHSNLSAIYLTCDQTCTVTFDGSSNPSFTLTAGTCYSWYTGNHITSPFPASVTTCTVVNGSSTTAATFQCRVLYH